MDAFKKILNLTKYFISLVPAIGLISCTCLFLDLADILTYLYEDDIGILLVAWLIFIIASYFSCLGMILMILYKSHFSGMIAIFLGVLTMAFVIISIITIFNLFTTISFLNVLWGS